MVVGVVIWFVPLYSTLLLMCLPVLEGRKGKFHLSPTPLQPGLRMQRDLGGSSRHHVTQWWQQLQWSLDSSYKARSWNQQLSGRPQDSPPSRLQQGQQLHLQVSSAVLFWQIFLDTQPKSYYSSPYKNIISNSIPVFNPFFGWNSYSTFCFLQLNLDWFRDDIPAVFSIFDFSSQGRKVREDIFQPKIYM